MRVSVRGGECVCSACGWSSPVSVLPPSPPAPPHPLYVQCMWVEQLPPGLARDHRRRCVEVFRRNLFSTGSNAGSLKVCTAVWCWAHAYVSDSLCVRVSVCPCVQASLMCVLLTGVDWG